MLNRFRLSVIAAAAIGFAVVCLPTLFSTRAEILPVKTYTAADGLPRDAVSKVRQDARGFLWFCTSEGLARFDGYAFKLYSKDDGLPDPLVQDFLITRSGQYLLATGAGLVHFNPDGVRGPVQAGSKDKPMFVTYLPPKTPNSPAETPIPVWDRYYIEVLYEDAQGVVWVGTRFDGLFRLEERDGQLVLHQVELHTGKNPIVVSMAEDQRGNLWAAAYVNVGNGELYRLSTNGRVEHFTKPGWRVHALVKDPRGRLWAGSDHEGVRLCLIDENSDGNRSVFSHCYGKEENLGKGRVIHSFQASDGIIWAGTSNGVVRLDANSPSDKPNFQLYGEQQGICSRGVYSVNEDRDGNLWFLTGCGAIRMTRNAFVRYDKEDGLKAKGANSIFTDRSGSLIVVTNEARDMMLNVFDGQRFFQVKANTPPGINHGWGTGQIVVNSRAGDWWFPTDESVLYRFRGITDVRQLLDARPQAYTAKEGFTDQMVWRMYEDLHGDLWISTSYQDKFLRWDHQTDKIIQLSAASNDPNPAPRPNAFVEDTEGTLWMGGRMKDQCYLLRHRNGNLKVFGRAEGIPANEQPRSLLIDGKGRLWFTSESHGIGRIDDPRSEPLKIAWHNRGNGLSTNWTESLVEDRYGRIYIGTRRGVDCLTPETGQVRSFTSADGLPKGSIYVAGRDTQDALWFASELGVARYVPEAPRPNQPPTIFLTGLRVAGVPQRVSEIGDLSLPELKLSPSQTNVTIDFLSPSATADPHLRYQYKLEGREDWSAPTEQRSVDFANLSAGSYRFLVRAVNADGIHSATPASVSFTVAAPVWQRWWFLALAVGAIGGLTFAAYRYRVAQLLALERMRTRIATDLHDEVGSSLSQIAILSEVARLRLPRNGQPDAAGAVEPMEKVAVTSREAVDAMSDIVWAINPQRDQLSDLTQRMRRFASDTLTARDIRLRFHAPEQDLSLDAEVRRQVFLVFKECVNNIARHAEATEVEIEFALADHHLSLRVWDNGHGFAETAPEPGQNGGNGLLSMRRRAQELGGRLEVSSGNGDGTTIRLEAPLGGRKLL
jgi:signal transduction histidine kinase/ligand-binding sensor domain-containing protein